MAPEIAECRNTVLSSTLELQINRALVGAVCKNGFRSRRTLMMRSFGRNYWVFLRNNRSRRIEVDVKKRDVVCFDDRSRILKGDEKN